MPAELQNRFLFHLFFCDADKEIRERRTEVQKQENRLNQREEYLDKRADSLEKKNENISVKQKQLDDKLLEIDGIKNTLAFFSVKFLIKVGKELVLRLLLSKT